MIRSYKILRHASALLSAAAMLWSVSAARADDLPPELRVIVTPDLPADPTQTADNNLLALNSAMFDLYGASGAIFQANFLAHHPVILALFSGAGGHFILYRPGQPPLDAPPVPIVYQLMKSVGHSTMALAEVVMPYIESPKNQAWRASLLAYRSRMQSALDSVNATDMQEDWKANNVSILQNNIAFMDQCAEKGTITLADMQDFAKKQAPLAEAQYRLGGRDPGRPLDAGRRRLEEAARQRLGQDLCRQQHDLCGPAEQRHLQRAGAVLPARCDQ